MKFYRILSAGSDGGATTERSGAAWRVAAPHLPSIECPSCGVWASSDRLRHLRPFDGLPTDYSCLPVAEWRARVGDWAARLGVSESELRPGAEIGPAHAVVRRTIDEDVIQPFPGELWATPRAASVLVRERLPGVSLVPVIVDGPRADARPLVSVVPMGRAWRRGSRAEDRVICSTCGRTTFPRPRDLTIDATSWPAAELFIVDDNPNMLFAAERFKALIQREALTGLELVEVDSQRALPTPRGIG